MEYISTISIKYLLS